MDYFTRQQQRREWEAERERVNALVEPLLQAAPAEPIITRGEWFVLCQLNHRFNFTELLRGFSLAFVDIPHSPTDTVESGVVASFDGLLSKAVILSINRPPLIHDDWRRHFPEYPYALLDLGYWLLNDSRVARAYIEPMDLQFKENYND